MTTATDSSMTDASLQARKQLQQQQQQQLQQQQLQPSQLTSQQPAPHELLESVISLYNSNNNTLVPESDLAVALNAIEESLQQRLSSLMMASQTSATDLGKLDSVMDDVDDGTTMVALPSLLSPSTTSCTIGAVVPAATTTTAMTAQASIGGVDMSSTDLDRVTAVCLQQCCHSFQRNLQRIVQPISDEAFSLYVQYHARRSNNYNSNKDGEHIDDWIGPLPDLDDESIMKQAVAQLDQRESSSNYCFDAEDDYDDTDLVDPELQLRAQQVRQEIGLQAARIRSLRSDTLQQVSILAKEEVEQIMNAFSIPATSSTNNPIEINNPVVLNRNQDGNSHDAMVVDEDGSTQLPEDVAMRLQELQYSLSSMMEALDQTNTEMPHEMTRFRETIGAIEHSLQRKSSSEQDPCSTTGGGSSLSQIERTITRRHDSNRIVIPSSLVAVDSNKHPTSHANFIPPDERLARLFFH